MTSNKLKILACISMACDHIGYIIFPQVMVLRYIGRLALPIFAFFIAEGCRYTRSKSKYFLQVVGLAVICQLFYVGESLLNGGIKSVYLNILFTFSLSIMVCSAYLWFANALKNHRLKSIIFSGAAFALSLGFTVFCCTYLSKVFGIPITVDYGIVGTLLPLFAVIFKDKAKKLIAFTVGTVIYCIFNSAIQPYTWFALLSLPLIAVYNGKLGTKKLKWAFYLFYPLHFAAIYGIDFLLNYFK